MFGLSFEHFIIAGVVLLLFGPKRLPELGHGIGKAIKNFKDGFSGADDVKKLEASKDEKKKPDDQENA